MKNGRIDNSLLHVCIQMENNQQDIMNKKILSKESHQGAGEKQKVGMSIKPMFLHFASSRRAR